MVFDRVKEIIVAQLKVEPDAVKPETFFIEDLGADSIDVMDMIASLEAEFSKEVEEESLGELKQVKDVVNYFEGL
ncbi:MAG: acyl carrier protein [Eubacteriaceae bacterium]|jgi:acyl carrier protein|nr:acyl carrier protein [Eubacteriaceae bacterium]